MPVNEEIAMTHRERWVRALHFQSVDHVPDEEFGYWTDTFKAWHDQVEVRGGSDPYPMRAKYGRQVLLMGGVDKTRLIEGKDAIRQEIRRLEKLVADGGFIPHVDHRCAPDVTYENYLYYLKTKREAFGIPEPAPFEERRAHGEVR
jgi:hypothetical protein